jgi:hypothetical protein
VTIACLVVGVLLLVGFVLAEQRVSHPLLPLRVILDRTRGGAYVSVGLAGVAIFGVFLFLVFYLQVVKGFSPLTCGLLFLPFVAGILLMSNVSSIVLLPRVGPRVLITTGMVLGGGGMLWLTQLTVASTYAADVLPGLVIMGLGFGMIFSPAINTATAGVRREDSGVASALVNTMQQVGGSIGTSALSTIALTATASYLIAHHTSPLAPAIAATRGYTLAFAVAAGLLGFGAIVAVILLPSRRRLAGLRAAAAPPAPAPAQAWAPAPAPAPTPAPEPAPAGAPASASAPAAGAGAAPEPRVVVVPVIVIPVAIVSCSPVCRASLAPPARR